MRALVGMNFAQHGAVQQRPTKSAVRPHSLWQHEHERLWSLLSLPSASSCASA